PDATGVRVIRRAVVQQDGGAQDQPAGDEPGSHHPAEIGEPPHEIARLEVETVRQILRRLHGEAAVHVHRTLRPAGRAGRVDDHVRMLGWHVGERVVAAVSARHHVVPPHVALAQAHLAGEPPRRPLFALEHERGSGRIVAERRGHVVQATAEPPRGPGDAARRVEHALVGRLPYDAKIALDRAPEALEVVDRPAVQRREVAVAGCLGEAAQQAAGEIPLGRTPGDVHAATGARSGARFAPLRARSPQSVYSTLSAYWSALVTPVLHRVTFRKYSKPAAYRPARNRSRAEPVWLN